VPSAKRRRERERAVRKRRLWIAGLGAASVLAVAVVAIMLSGGGSSDASGIRQTQSVTVDGEALPSLPSSGADPAIGMAAPLVSGRSFDGMPVATTNDGRPKAIWLVAHWCPHCQAEVPRIVSLQQRGLIPAGIDVVAVSTSVNPSAPNYPPSSWFQGVGWPYPVVADDDGGTVAHAFGLTSFPYLVLVGADGKVVARSAGELGDEGIVQALNQLAP
jgi:thiol-disulfide isomerase/thioredoxin